MLSLNTKDKLLLLKSNHSIQSVSSSHPTHPTHSTRLISNTSAKSILTMDFDINDLSVAPDYQFREKSPRFGASSPPVIGVFVYVLT